MNDGFPGGEEKAVSSDEINYILEKKTYLHYANSLNLTHRHTFSYHYKMKRNLSLQHQNVLQ